MPHPAPLRAAAISALAVWAAGCASVPGLSSGTNKTPAVAAKTPATTTPAAAQVTAPAAGTSLEAQLESAHALRLQNHLPEATKALAQLVLVAPDNPQVVAEYGKALVQQQRPEDAIAFLKHAAELRPDDWTVYSALGVAYDQNDDRKNAKTAYERALLLHPGEPDVLNNYGVSRMLAGDLDGAQKLLLAAQAAGSKNPKLEGNLQKLAEIKARKPAGTTTAQTAVQATTDKTGEPRTIVMQQGPDASASATASLKKVATKPHREASTRSSKPKVAKVAPAPPPALRTAAQGE